MPIERIRHIAVLLFGGSFFIFDRLLKQAALTDTNFTWYLWQPLLGWEYFENTGVAFGIPIPWYAAFVYTPVLLVALFWYYSQKNKPYTSLPFFGLTCIVFGALSNLLDRVWYHFTIDYIRIFTSIINLADIMIVTGALLLFFWQDQKRNTQRL